MGDKPEPACLGCGYFSFDGLKKACFHPAIAKHLTGGPLKCAYKRASDDKGTDPGNVRRLSLMEFRERAAA